MQLFNLGEWVIDTRSHATATVVSVIPHGENSTADVYVLEKDEGELYLSTDEHLVFYDKYYWDNLPGKARE